MPDTIIGALIALFGVAFGSVVAAAVTWRTAKLSVESALQLKTFELFFHEKATAYKEFFNACDSYLQSPASPEAIKNFYEANSNAILFSSLDTQVAISAYGKQLLESKFPRCSSEESMELAQARTALILAMQSELKEQAVPSPKRPRISSKSPGQR